jgi:hypothetical protein
MNTLLLSLLLLVLIAIGLVMGRQITEGFAPLGEKQEITASPALANMLKTDIATETKKVDSLKRELDLLHAMASAPATEEKKTKKSKKSKKSYDDYEEEDEDDYEGDENDYKRRRPQHRCPDCPRCPDMSQYIKMDEIPCWNCTLP